jgi:predicted transcriptional regulator
MVNGELIDQMKQMNSKIDRLLEISSKLVKILENTNFSGKASLTPQADIMTLLTLSEPLRKTAMALYKVKEATANDIAKETGRQRSCESASANELVRLGFVKKRRQNHNVYFYIDSEGLEH